MVTSTPNLSSFYTSLGQVPCSLIDIISLDKARTGILFKVSEKAGDAMLNYIDKNIHEAAAIAL